MEGVEEKTKIEEAVVEVQAELGHDGVVVEDGGEKGEMEMLKMGKKRGRPRKYESCSYGGSLALAHPLPISSSCFSYVSAVGGGKVRPFEVVKRKQQQTKYEYESTGECIAYSVGTSFTPHIININTGEDITMKLLSFSQQGARAICILSANGSISNVTLRQPSSSGGTLTYEGRFELLSLTGSFMPTDKDGAKSRSGGMSVSLAGPDGRVIGGGLAGLLVAASLVQVVVGSFLPGHQQEQKPKKQQGSMPSPVQAAIDGFWSSGKPTQVPVVTGGAAEMRLGSTEAGERRGNGGNGPLMNCFRQ